MTWNPTTGSFSPLGVGELTSFGLPAGRRLAGRYEVVGLLGVGWESEVYLVRELAADIERAAKLFFPRRNRANRVARQTARRLHKLRDCPGLVQYVAQESVTICRQTVTALISEYVPGELLSDFIDRQAGQRLGTFEALHLLHAMAVALEPIHDCGEYHGDLHAGNVLLRRRGINFSLKLIDVYQRDQRRIWSVQDDVYDAIRLFYEAIGGSRYYARQPPLAKYLCGGLKRSVVAKRLRNAGELRRYLESATWGGV